MDRRPSLRTHYKFLGVLKPMFPDVPILGLTATATSKVTIDVQKMLDIQGCLVLKSSFNRPNLYYEVRPKPSSQKECIDELEDLLKNRFANKSGIIYTTSIKDCEELREELRKRGLRVSGYHAQLDIKLRSSVHEKWLRGEYQAVVATIAFGLGIDKPDVRFVIHHCLSKSMENFYQESGRAGRDGKRSDCILFYRLADVFKLSTMVFTQQTGLQNLYGIVDYCLDPTKCRRAIIASHFDESWESTHCDKMCDHCKSGLPPKEVDITKHCRSLLKLLTHASSEDTKMTAQKLLEAWYGKGPPKLRLSNIAVPSFSRSTGDSILARLLVDGYLKEDFHFTAYSTISYIRKGPKASRVDDPSHVISMKLAGKAERSSTNSTEEKNDNKEKPVKKTSSSTKVKKEPMENEVEGKSGTSADKKRTLGESGNTPKRTKVYVIEDSDSD